MGLELADPVLTRIVHETVTDGRQVRHGYFAQFVARALSRDLGPGHEVVEARWFEALPDDLAYREDYVEDFGRVRKAASF